MPAARRSAATLGLERLMLMSLALVLSLAACQEPEQATGPSLSQSALPNSITLTYICGNAFRVRNTNPTVMTVTWDVYKTTEKGTLTLPAKPGTGPYSETYFTTVNKGTVRLFLDGVLIQTKANGNKPVCQLPADTTRPVIPPRSGLPTAPMNTVANPSNPQAIYYRDFVAIRFDTLASGPRIREILAQFQATIVGGVPRLAGVELYFVKVPDPGPSWNDLQLLIQRLAQEPGVDNVGGLQFGAVPTLRGRYPVDALTAPARDSWFGPAGIGDAQRTINAFNSIRAPLAWGCETGLYGTIAPAIGVLDFFFDGPTSDLNVASLVRPTVGDSLIAIQPVPKVTDREHGLGVASVAAAIGDNGTGTTGVAWGAPLYLYAFATGGQIPGNLLVPFYRALNAADQSGVQILNLSFTFGDSLPDSSQVVQEIARGLRWFLDRSPHRIIVLALPEIQGGAGMTSALAEVASGRAPRTEALDVAAAKVALLPAYAGRILFVAGTTALSGAKWAPSDVWTGGRTIAAPADGILTLSSSPAGFSWQGNSFAAPMVGGVAALLWAMDPNLTASEVTDYLLRGAQVEREDPATGATIERSDIGVPGVYQLDAYGSLKLLSYERPGTPICGLAVLTALVDDSASQQAQTTVRIEGRPGVIYQGEPATVTVAQGGRRIGLDRGDGSLDLNLQNGFWDAGTVGAFQGIRQFLERDTAFIVSVNDMGEGIQIRGPSGQGSPEFPCATVAAGTYDVNFCRIGMVSNTGDWVHAVVERDNSDAGCGPLSSHFASFLVPVRGAAGGATVLRDVRFEACRYFEPGSWNFPVADVVAWRADGAVAWVAQSDASISTSVQAPDSAGELPTYHSTITSMTTKFRQESVVSGVPAATSRTVSGPAVYALGWRVEGGSLLSYEYYLESFGVCVRTVRAGEAPEVEVAGPIQLPPSYCGDRQLESMPASVIARSLTSALRPAGGSAGTPRALSPVEARIRAIRRRAGPQVLLAN
jgi:hypothetical protein